MEGSILLRWINWHVTFFFAMPSTLRCTFWSEHESIQTGIYIERAHLKHRFLNLYVTKVIHVLVSAVYHVDATVQVTCTHCMSSRKNHYQSIGISSSEMANQLLTDVKCLG